MRKTNLGVTNLRWQRNEDLLCLCVGTRPRRSGEKGNSFRTSRPATIEGAAELLSYLPWIKVGAAVIMARVQALRGTS